MPPARQRTFNKADTTSGQAPKRTSSIRGGGGGGSNRSSKHAASQSSSREPAVSAARANMVVPGVRVAFAALLSARLCAALWSHITDCDETFNYWEPLHYLLYGRGLQTWEYSPEFALRSYTYLLLHGVPAFVYERLTGASPVMVFYFVRGLLALTCASVEVYFYKSVCREFGIQIGRLWLLFQLFQPGLFHASVALLPSSFAMYACSAALAAWWNRQHRLAIFCIAIAALLGWPFAALVGLPIAGDLLLRRRHWRTFLLWSAISALTVLLPQLVIDSSYFGRLAVAPLNIVMYNVFGGEGGPNLYGTEPWHFYALNGALNFNVLWPLALATPLLLVLGWLCVPARAPATLMLPHWLSLLPFYLWLAVFTVQPHKEERFLFPVYFMVALCAAISVDTVQRLAFRAMRWWRAAARPGAHYLDSTTWMSALVMLGTAALGLSRIAALYVNYHGPLDVWSGLEPANASASAEGLEFTNVCAGKDWYRYPGGFFLPSEGEFRMRFVRSQFEGILPAYYDGGRGPEADVASAKVHGYFNDANRAAAEMYTELGECDYLFDLDVGRYSELEPDYAGGEGAGEWRVVESARFLDAQESHPLWRAFYVPGVSERFVRWGRLNLLRRVQGRRPEAAVAA